MYQAERKFVNTAQSGVQSLMALCADVNGNPGGHAEAMKTLGAIKTSAQSIEARAVYRAALLCADIVARHPFASADGTRKISAAVTELSHLTSLYADGLNEIDTEHQAAIPADEAQDLAPAIDDETAHKNAAEILAPLLPLVKDETLKTALGALMKAQSIDNEDGVSTEVTLQDEPQIESGISFDALMRPVTNLVLSEARHSGKAVSVSYAADFTAVRQRAAEDLQNLLEVICLTIVARGVVGISKKSGNTPASMPPTQITITGKQAGAALQFHVAWRGENLENSASEHTHFAQSLTALSVRGGEVEFQPALKLSLAQTEDAASARPQQSLTITFPLCAAVLKVTPKTAAPKIETPAVLTPEIFVDDMSADLAIAAGGTA